VQEQQRRIKNLVDEGKKGSSRVASLHGDL
jgi:hypothetical protein